MHTYNPQPMSLLSINFLHLTVSEIQSGQDFIGQGHCGKVKSRSHHDVAHLHPLANVSNNLQVSSSYTLQFLRYRPDKLFLPLTSMPAHLDTMGENNTPTAIKGCGVKIKQKHSKFTYLEMHVKS